MPGEGEGGRPNLRQEGKQGRRAGMGFWACGVPHLGLKAETGGLGARPEGQPGSQGGAGCREAGASWTCSPSGAAQGHVRGAGLQPGLLIPDAWEVALNYLGIELERKRQWSSYKFGRQPKEVGSAETWLSSFCFTSRFPGGKH